jgi:uncharacterized membrane protein
MNKFKDKDMQVVIGWILRIGVVASMIIVTIGGVIFLYRHGNSVPDYHTFKGVRQGTGILHGLFNMRGQAIILAGIILLIATPVMRVAFSIAGFLIEKDYLYTLISLIVLLIIVISMLSGQTG